MEENREILFDGLKNRFVVSFTYRKLLSSSGNPRQMRIGLLLLLLKTGEIVMGFNTYRNRHIPGIDN
jgi:hypothetical protein